jgi:glycerol-3-phosphate acyltransferase PlsX
VVDQVTVAVDANGADLGPAEVARGAAQAAAGGHKVILFGPAGEMDAADGVEIVDAPVSIAKAPDPARAVRSTPDASIVQAVEAVADGRADALVSGGSTGAALAASLFRFKRARGVHRPALAIVVPVPGSPFLLLDAGANVAVRPEHLVQFAHMGAAFMEVVMGVERPRVALLSNGEEPSKGPEDVVAAHAALTANPGGIDFIGNVEGFAIGKGVADVLVADGFTGNVALKVLESTIKVLGGEVRSRIRSGPLSSLGGLLIRGKLGQLRDEFDPEQVGGAILLGLRKPVVVAHGSFGPTGIEHAVKLARRAVDEDMVGRTAAALEAAGALRSASAASVAQR